MRKKGEWLRAGVWRAVALAMAAGVLCVVVPGGGCGGKAAADEWVVRDESTATPFERVVWIGVDGIGTFFQNAETPNFDRIFEGGKVTWNAYSPVPTLSAPAWCSMFYGVPYSVHETTNAIAETEPFRHRELKSVFRQTLDQYPGEAVGVFATWHAIPYGMVDSRAEDTELTLYPGGMSDMPPETVLESAESWIREQKDFRMLFFYIDNTDIAGHVYGYGAPGYFMEIERADRIIGQLYDTLEEQGLLEDTLILLSTDHGGTPDGQHGGATREETTCVFAVRGNGLRPGTEIGEMELPDIAAIVRHALGLEQPDFSGAKVPEGIFPDL